MAIKRIDLSIQIQKWKEARKGKEVRAANVEAFEQIEEVVNEAVDGANQASDDVSGAMNAANATIVRSNEVLNQATNRANQTMDHADEILADATVQAEASADSATLSESWAVGGTNIRPGEDNDNSRYYSLQSKTEAQRAEDAAARAEQYAGFVVPILTVNFVTGNLDYPTTENIIFIINRVTGKLDYALA